MTYEPVFELTRGDVVESVHFGAAAVVDSGGNLLFSRGDPGLVTYLRSSAKPFQLLPFIKNNGHQKFGLTNQEIAVMCASHSGTPEHIAVVEGIQKKIGVTMDDLLCGTHFPFHGKSADELKIAGLQPSQLHHNCSGKHTGMLAHAKLEGAPIQDYVDLNHPVQKNILEAFAVMCNFEADQVEIGIDGCSAPNFAVPLYNAALAFARLCHPVDLSPETQIACETISTAMSEFPFMVAGPERFDTILMEAAQGKIIAKGGAEGFMSIGIKPDAAFDGSPGIGIAIKISDGDGFGRAREAFSLQILQALGVLTPAIEEMTSAFGPVVTLRNFRKLQVGDGHPSSPVNIKWQ